MKFTSIAMPLILLLSGCASAPGPAVSDDRARADILILDGTIVPVTSEPFVGSLAIDDGVIVALGPTSGIVDRYSADETIDASGAAVLPGFVNAHTHAPMTLFRGIADDLPLMEWLTGFIFPAEAENVDRDFVRAGTRLAAAEMIRSGTTTFADMYYYESDIAEETRRTGLRAVLGETMIDFPAPDNPTWDAAVAYVRRFVARWKGDELITPAIAPHAPFTVSPEHLQEVRALATELGVPILIHLAETTDEVSQIETRHQTSPTRLLANLGFLADDVVGAHGIHLDDEDIRLLRRYETGIVHCPESNMMLASGVARVGDLLAAGVELGLGTDGPAGSNNNLDMIEEMASAARLQKIHSMDSSAISSRVVLEMATMGGARVLGLDDLIGSLEVGKRADVIVIDLEDPGIQPVYSVESAIVYAANGADVEATIVDGKMLMRNRRLLTLDEDEVMRDAQVIRDRVVASLAAE
ncbi:MAG: amidohydrolase [Acidobacteria bacterium]|nr:amidohydrolase [Acidobacteriota bacterium]